MGARGRLVMFAPLLALALLLSAGVAEVWAATPSNALVIQSVNSSSYPRVELLLAVPPKLVQEGSKPEFSVAENGVRRKVEKAVPIGEEDRAPIDVVLVLDASGSMAGAPLAAAQEAASWFVYAMGPADRIAVLAIGESPQLLSGFTSDRGVLGSAIGSLRARGETALYDTLVKAGSMLDSTGKRTSYVVLLSDGGDTVSRANLDDAVRLIAARGAPVYGVALTSPEYRPDALSSLARSTRGRVMPVGEAGELTGIFRAIAEEIQTSWSVTYRSADPPTPDLEIEIGVRSGGGESAAVTVIDNPGFVAGEGAALGERTLGIGFLLAARGIALAFGVSIALLFAVIGFLLRREGTAIDQVSFYRAPRDAAATEGGPVPVDDDSIRARLQSTVDQVVGGHGVRADFKKRIERAGLHIRPDEFMYFHLIGVVVAGVVTRVFTGNLLVMAVVLVAAALGPVMYLDMAASRRRSRFDAQLPDIVSLISSSLRAGWGIQQALELIVGEIGEPAATEFSRVQSETRLGLSLEESLEKMARRLGSEDFRWIASAIAIQREVGGNLAEILDIAVGTIRERAELRREVHSLTAEGRFSAIVLIALPFLLLAALAVVSPKYLSSMTASSYGPFMLAFAALLLAVGGVWLYRISKVEV